MKREIVRVTVEYKYKLEYSDKAKKEEALELISKEVPCGRMISAGSGYYKLNRIEQTVLKIEAQKQEEA